MEVWTGGGAVTMSNSNFDVVVVVVVTLLQLESIHVDTTHDQSRWIQKLKSCIDGTVQLNTCICR